LSKKFLSQISSDFILIKGLVTGTNYTWNSGCKPYPFPPHGSTEYTAPSCVSSCTSSAWNVAYTQDKKYSLVFNLNI